MTLWQSHPPMAETNWADVNWDEEVILPASLDEYSDEVAKLEQKNDFDAIKNLEIKKHQKYDDEALDSFQAPPSVRKLVQGYRENVNSKTVTEAKKTELKEDLKAQIKGLFIEQPVVDENLEENFIDIGKVEPLKIKKAIPVNGGTPSDLKGKIKERTLPSNVTGLISRLWSSLSLIPTANADTPTSFMDYYDGIENRLVDSALYYLAQSQNEDGSFGTYKKYTPPAYNLK